MTTVKHNSTGTVYTVTKVAPKTIYLRVLEVGTNKNLYVGMDQKTSPAGIAAFYTIIN